jgi:hypothetical protein
MKPKKFKERAAWAIAYNSTGVLLSDHLGTPRIYKTRSMARCAKYNFEYRNFMHIERVRIVQDKE